MIVRRIYFLAILSYSLLSGQAVHITGKIITGQDQPLPYANVIVSGTSTGTVSDGDGYFSIDVPESDTVKISVTYIGYETASLALARSEIAGIPLTIVLKKSAIAFSPISIIGSRTLKKSQRIEPSLRVLGAEQLDLVPAIGGSDVFRMLQTLPGVNSTSELSNNLYIRGGTPDQNLVLINGIPVYQPFHLFGLSSSVDGASVDLVRYYSGGFSVRFGDRLSSVLDITTKPGSDSLAATLDLNLVNSGATVAGPVGKKLRWRISGRRSYFDLVGKMAGSDFPYYFYDLEGKISFIPDTRTLVTFNTFLSSDSYDSGYKRYYYNELYKNHSDPAVAFADSNEYRLINESRIGWKNKLASIGALRRHSQNALSEFTVYSSILEQNLFNQKSHVPHADASASTLKEAARMNEIWRYDSEASDVSAFLRETGFRLLHEMEMGGRLEASFGGGYSFRTLDYGWNMRDFDVINTYINLFMDFPPDSLNFDLNLNTAYGFGEIVLSPIDAVWLRCGLRVEDHSAYGAPAIDPRANLTWVFHPLWSLKLGWGRFSQSLSTSTEYGFYSVASLYYPNREDIPRSTHMLAGIVYDDINKLLIELSGYVKSFEHLFYVGHDGQFLAGDGGAYGLELLAARTVGKSWLCQLAYGYTVIEKTQGQETFNPNYDQRHKLNLQVNGKIGSKWCVTVNWGLATGRPANLASIMAYSGYILNRGIGASTMGPFPFMLEAPKNIFRYPPFHRMDLTLERERQFRNGSLQFYIQVLNVYNRKNIVFYEDIEENVEFVDDPENPGTFMKHRTYSIVTFNGFPFFPAIGVRYEF